MGKGGCCSERQLPAFALRVSTPHRPGCCGIFLLAASRFDFLEQIGGVSSVSFGKGMTKWGCNFVAATDSCEHKEGGIAGAVQRGNEQQRGNEGKELNSIWNHPGSILVRSEPNPCPSAPPSHWEDAETSLCSVHLCDPPPAVGSALPGGRRISQPSFFVGFAIIPATVMLNFPFCVIPELFILRYKATQKMIKPLRGNACKFEPSS